MEANMPIDRPDGRHWCDPASEVADEYGCWTCSCSRVWRYEQHGQDMVWAQVEDVPAEGLVPTGRHRKPEEKR